MTGMYHKKNLPAGACVARRPVRYAAALTLALLASGALCPEAGAQVDRSSAPLEEVVVTATSRPELRSKVVGTVNVIDSEAIARSTARSLTELLSQNAAAFLNEWTPGQTQVNIRGGATDGQGRDFRSQVLILLNGRRAGTANISKLSPSAVSRIEIVRGPSSVVYGSQNIGGVVNIITKSGSTAPGASIQLSGGSWGLLQGDAQIGGEAGSIDWYLSASAGERDDFDAGEGGSKQINTSWERRGATGAFGYQFNSDHRIHATARTDGIYDAGFRGSAANYVSEEDRYNRSLDLVYSGQQAGGPFDWQVHAYGVTDVDDLRWAAPIIRSATGQPVPGTSLDHNYREIEVIGSRVQPRASLWTGNQLLFGWDWERSTVRSTRERVGVNGAPISQVPPFDNNQTEEVHALYFEDAQSLFGDRLTLRGGVRVTQGETSFDTTPNLVGQVPGTEDYDATTYAGGIALKATEAITLRAGVASGFRAPNATELAADFTALGGGRTFGNPNLEPESSSQVEIGANFRTGAWRGDFAVFRNVIEDRIVTRPRPNTVNTNDYVNNPGDVVIEGVELQTSVELLALFGSQPGSWYWSISGGGAYHWDMIDEGARSTANTRNVERVYEYQGSVGMQVGRDSGTGWQLSVDGILHGPVWYNTEELLLVPFAEPDSNYIHEKSSYWIWNARAEVQLTEKVLTFASVNNIFDQNYHPLLIATDEAPYLLDPRFSNGGLGTSLPGREFQIGIRLSFGQR